VGSLRSLRFAVRQCEHSDHSMADRAFHFAHEGTKKHEGHEDHCGPFVPSLPSFAIFV
jgi:hypothetical protein